VRATGGLAESVIDAGRYRSTGTGFAFVTYKTRALIEVIDRAMKAYRSSRTWLAMQKRAMAAQFTWERSAREYEKLYRKAIRLHNAV
jgi:starch synthase